MSGEYRVTTLGGTFNLPLIPRLHGTPSPPPLRRWFSNALTIPYILPRQHRRRFGYYVSKLRYKWFCRKSFLYCFSTGLWGILYVRDYWRSVGIMDSISVRVKARAPTLPFPHKFHHFGQQRQSSITNFLVW